MGYYTKYKLEVETDNPLEIESMKYILTDISGWNQDSVFDGYGDGQKWYDHENDMKELSRRYPDAVFHLHGEGEENEDIWEKHFKNGKTKVCKAQIVIAPFDPKELK